MESKIYDICIDKDVDTAETRLNELGVVKFVDEKIDDGLDDGVYLMMKSFDLVTETDKFYVRLYYGNDDYIVTDVMVDNG